MKARAHVADIARIEALLSRLDPDPAAVCRSRAACTCTSGPRHGRTPHRRSPRSGAFGVTLTGGGRPRRRRPSCVRTRRQVPARDLGGMRSTAHGAWWARCPAKLPSSVRSTRPRWRRGDHQVAPRPRAAQSQAVLGGLPSSRTASAPSMSRTSSSSHIWAASRSRSASCSAPPPRLAASEIRKAGRGDDVDHAQAPAAQRAEREPRGRGPRCAAAESSTKQAMWSKCGSGVHMSSELTLRRGGGRAPGDLDQVGTLGSTPRAIRPAARSIERLAGQLAAPAGAQRQAVGRRPGWPRPGRRRSRRGWPAGSARGRRPPRARSRARRRAGRARPAAAAAPARAAVATAAGGAVSPSRSAASRRVGVGAADAVGQTALVLQRRAASAGRRWAISTRVRSGIDPRGRLVAAGAPRARARRPARPARRGRLAFRRPAPFTLRQAVSGSGRMRASGP